MTEGLILILPVLLPLTTAALCTLGRPNERWQTAVGLTGAALNLAAAAWLLWRVHEQGILVTYLGGWPVPFGIGFAGDRLGTVMAFMAALVGLLGAAFAVPTLPHPAMIGRFMALLHLMLAGLGGFFLTADLFNFYVWFELILVASFGLLVLDADRPRFEAAIQYFLMNILGSMLLLSGVGLLYATTGTLNLADLAQHLDALNRPHLVTALGMLMLVALGIKSAIFPLFFWLPAAYPSPPIAVTAIFGGLLTKTGVYGLLRLFTLLFVQETGYTHPLILIVGGLTMIAGILGALAQHELRRLLSFLIISEIGFVLIGLGLYTAAGLAAAIFFTLHIIVVTTAMLFLAGMILRLRSHDDLRHIGGLYAERSAVAGLFLLPALSLGGMPPFSGFIGKLAIVRAGLAADRPVIIAVALAVSLLTLYAIARIWTLAFWAPSPSSGSTKNTDPIARMPLLIWAPPAVLAALAVIMGLAAEPVFGYAAEAAQALLNRSGYIDAVLPGGSP